MEEETRHPERTHLKKYTTDKLEKLFCFIILIGVPRKVKSYE